MFDIFCAIDDRNSVDRDLVRVFSAILDLDRAPIAATLPNCHFSMGNVVEWNCELKDTVKCCMIDGASRVD